MLIDEGLELLTEAQCWELLASSGVGRVGITIAGLPAILPVNYVQIDGDIVFRTSTGTKLHAATQRAVVAFEVDSYDPDAHEGWSVLLVGRSTNVSEETERADLEGQVSPAWADGNRTEFVRIKPEFISGRRIVAPEL
jgi:uncharacterized protein